MNNELTPEQIKILEGQGFYQTARVISDSGKNPENSDPANEAYVLGYNEGYEKGYEVGRDEGDDWATERYWDGYESGYDNAQTERDE